MKQKKWIASFATILVIFALTATPSFALKINEIYPAPPSGEFEWTELYNDEDKEINLSDYQLIDAANNTIKLPSIILGLQSFIVASSSSVLNNTGENLYLKKGSDTIDSVSYSETFNSQKIFVRCPDGSGQWSTLTSMSKGQSNSTNCPSPPTSTPEPSPTPTDSPMSDEITISPTSTPTPTPPAPHPTPITINNIYISEFMPYPPTGEKEWVEIYNDNNTAVTLSSWFIDDIEDGGSSPQSFTLIIQSKGLATIELSSSLLNNTGDTLRLLDSQKNLLDITEYISATEGKAWGRSSFSSDIFCLQNATKNFANESCLITTSPTLTPTSTSAKPTSTPTPSPANPPAGGTPTPSIQKPTLTPFFQESGSTSSDEFPPHSQNGQTLGISEKPPEKSTLTLPQLLSLNAFSYSLLTLISLFLRMKS